MKHSFLFFYFVEILSTTNKLLNMLYFDILTNVNIKELMQCQYGTATSTMVDNPWNDRWD